MRNGSNTLIVDTNVLVYVYDPRDRFKQDRASFTLDRLLGSGGAALSVQCLTEFVSAVTGRLPERLSSEQALERVETFMRLCTIFDLTQEVVLAGCQAAVRYQLSIWDALIWAVANVNGVTAILTEDAEHDRVIGDVRYLNPFSPAFDLDALRV